MQLVVLRSRKNEGESRTQRYTQELNTRFAERVLGNLRGRPGCCTACGPDCNACRDRYDDYFDKGLTAVIDLPAVLPYLIENPRSFLPQHVPSHDVILAIAIHEQILLEVARSCRGWGTKGIVVPLEAPDWIRGATRAEIHRVCEEQGVEVSFPKPFCAFAPPKGSVLAKFREQFHIGCPDVELQVEDEKITDAFVRVSAACGTTYAVARWLVGRSVEENLEIEVVSKRWHAFPCTASMERDPELGGETPLHVAGQAHYAILAKHKRVAGLESGLVTSPLGTTVLKPVPPKENLRRVEVAKQMIIARLKEHGALSLRELAREKDMNPAAISSAALLLKKEGKIRAEGAKVYSPS